MNKNVKIAKQLIKLAKNIIALDEEGDGSGFQVYHDIENNDQERLDRAEKEGKKYILHHKEGNLWRIQACTDFVGFLCVIEKGKFGGLIQKEENLSHDGYCWVSDNAKVYGDSKVYGDAMIYDKVKVSGKAQICEMAQVSGKAQIYGNAQVKGYVEIYDNTQIYGNAKVYEGARICDYAKVSGNAQVYGDALVCQGTQIYGDAKVYGNARVRGNAQISGNAKVDYDVKDDEITE